MRADDSRSYEILALAAPGLPDHGPVYHHAQRLFIHYIVGTIAHFSGWDLGGVYQGIAVLCSILIALLLLRFLTELGLNQWSRNLLFGAFVCNPYAFRYYWIAPTMIADLVFVLGLGGIIWGLHSGRFLPVFLSGIVAMLGRQNALLIIPGVMVWMFFASSWAKYSNSKKVYFSLTFLGMQIGLYQGLGHLVLPFTGHPVIGASLFVSFFTWLTGETFQWKILFEHILRVFIPGVLTLFLICGFILASREIRKKIPFEFWASLFLAASLAVQPLVVEPIGMAQNQSRQSSIALLALIVALAYLLRQIQYVPRKWMGVFVLGCIFLSSLHHMYSIIGPQSAAYFALWEIAVSAMAGLVVFSSFRNTWTLARNFNRK